MAIVPDVQINRKFRYGFVDLSLRYTKRGCIVGLKYELRGNVGIDSGDYLVSIWFEGEGKGFRVNDDFVGGIDPSIVFKKTKYRGNSYAAFSAAHVFPAIEGYWHQNSSFRNEANPVPWIPCSDLKSFFSDVEVRRVMFDFFTVLADRFYPAHGFVHQRLDWAKSFKLVG